MFWALPVYAQSSYSFVRGAAVRFGVSAYQQPAFTQGEAPLRRVDDDVGLSGPARGRVAGPCRKRASGRSLPNRRGWGPLRSDGDGGSRLGGTSSSALNWPEAPQTYRPFRAACLRPGALGGNCFRMENPTFGMSPGGLGIAFPSRIARAFADNSFCAGAAFAFRRKIDIILISPRFAGRKRRSRRRASNVVGVAPECSRRRTLDRRGTCLPTTIRKRILANPRNRVNL